jgi:uncharacterized delta-60 repeat protein
MKMRITILICLLIAYSVLVFPQAGSPDLSFGGNGKLITLVGSHDCAANGVALQQDGKIVVAGNYYNTTSKTHDFAIVRYNTNGSLDNSFAGNGKAAVDFGFEDKANAIAIQQDGKIIAAGYSVRSSDIDSVFYAITRVNTNGQLDNTFGVQGKVTVNVRGVLNAVAIQADGKIVVTGTNFGTDFILFRFNSNGTLDNIFGDHGKVITNLGDNAGGSAHAIAIQQDGQILVAGEAYHSSYFAVARYNSNNGSLDGSFSGGFVFTPIGNSSIAEGNAVTVQQNGKILVAGYYKDGGGSNDFAVIRLNSNGTLDNTFAGNGKADVAFGGDDRANTIALQPNGQIIMAGYTQSGTTKNFALCRLNSNGTIDNSFGASGKEITGFDAASEAFGSAIQTDGKIVVAGSSGIDIAVARYLGSAAGLKVANPGNVNAVTPENHFITVYPNPAANTLQLEGLNPSASTTILIMDAAGRTRRKEMVVFKSNASVNIEQFSSGIYFLEMIEDNHYTITRFIKK